MGKKKIENKNERKTVNMTKLRSCSFGTFEKKSKVTKCSFGTFEKQEEEEEEEGKENQNIF